MAPRRNNTNHHHHSHHPTPPPQPQSLSSTIDVQSFLGLNNDLTTNSTNNNNNIDHQNNNLTILSLTSNSNTLTSSSSTSAINNNNNIINFDIQNLQNNMTSSTAINNNNNNTTHNNNNNNNNNNTNNNHHHQQQQQQQNQQSNINNLNENYTKCCVPIGECFKLNISPDYGLIGLDDLSDCIRVLCNNENCTTGQYMHRECFESWEQSVLTSLKSIGRARSWSDRQRQQNLWTKKGYDLVYKACSCKCGRGHLKKDLDWQPPSPPQSGLSSSLNNNNNNNIYGRSDDDSTKKKKKRNRNNQKPTLAITSINPNGYHPNSGSGKQQLTSTSSSNNGNTNTNNNNNNGNNGGVIIEQLRGRTGSLSSSNGSTSPPVSASSEHSISPIHNGNLLIGGNKKPHQQQQQSQIQQICSPQQEHLQQTIYQQQFQLQQQQQHQQLQQQNHQIINAQQLQKTKVEIYSERVRSTSGCNGIFSRRIDFSTFNQLPKTRLNSYQVKMEDEGNHGNDETRLFILSSLAQNQKSRVNCILCEDAMLVFDRYPLVDGSFFLSPKQYSPGCIEVKYEGRIHYLTAVCMGCLDGNSCSRGICCRFCGERWDGSSLVLGTMYSYDIFAAMPCCAERLKCNACFKLLLPPEQRLNFYSDYSHCVTCPYCTTQDAHFVKPLAHCYTKQISQSGIQLP